MSAGEQKVFLLLETIFKADKYSLILIDEIDLLLHNIALEKLLNVIESRATKKSLQIIFTTHRESIIELCNLINIRHIVAKANKTYCFNETKPDAIYRLTGKQEKPIEIFVEDDLAAAIVRKIASNLKIQKLVSIKKFGAAINCFTAVAGILISQESIDNLLFVLDGDVFITMEDKTEIINKLITGHGDNVEDCRKQALQNIKQLNLPENIKPEPYLHSLLIQINDLDDEILEIAKDISYEEDNHMYLYKIIEQLNYEKSIGYTKIIDLISTHCQFQWQEYISEVYQWLENKVPEVKEVEKADKNVCAKIDEENLSINC